MKKGWLCNSVLIYEMLDVKKEFYISIDYDRQLQKPVITYSKQGGMSLKEIEKRYADTLYRIPIDVQEGLSYSKLLEVADNLGVHEKQSSLVFLLKNLWECFVQRDALTVQINPLIFSKDDKFYAAHCFVRTDPDASYRQQEIQSMRDYSQLHPMERATEQQGIKFIKTDGNIGVISNGAAMAQASMDFITQLGGKCGSFCDVGGQTYHEQIQYVFMLLQDDPETKVIYINCYGGLQDTQKIAGVIITEFKKIKTLDTPLVIRLKGLSAKESMKQLQDYIDESGTDLIHIVEDFGESAELAAKLS